MSEVKNEWELFDVNDNTKDLWFNDIPVGSCFKDVDGYFYFEFKDNAGGLWSEYSLKQIVKILEKLNEEWDKIVREKLNKNQ